MRFSMCPVPVTTPFYAIGEIEDGVGCFVCIDDPSKSQTHGVLQVWLLKRNTAGGDITWESSGKKITVRELLGADARVQWVDQVTNGLALLSLSDKYDQFVVDLNKLSLHSEFDFHGQPYDYQMTWPPIGLAALQEICNEEVQPQAQIVQLVSPCPPQVQAMNPNEQKGVDESMLAKVALECGGKYISASQEEVLATSSFLGGDNDLAASASQDDGDEEEVFGTPPDATQQEDHIAMCTLPFTPADATQQRGDAIAMCTLPFTPSPSQPQSPAPPSADADGDLAAPADPGRKVRGARISSPTSSPEQQPLQQPQPVPQLQAEQQQPQPEEQLQAEPQQQQQQQQPDNPLHDDPLIRAVLMIPTRTTTAAAATSRRQNGVEEFLALARQRGLYGTQN